MKNIITLMFLSLLLTSCNYYITSGVVVDIENYNKDSLCIFEVESGYWIYPNYKFVMTCGGFNIGDTIKLTK